MLLKAPGIKAVMLCQGCVAVLMWAASLSACAIPCVLSAVESSGEGVGLSMPWLML